MEKRFIIDQLIELGKSIYSKVRKLQGAFLKHKAEVIFFDDEFSQLAKLVDHLDGLSLKETLIDYYSGQMDRPSYVARLEEQYLKN